MCNGYTQLTYIISAVYLYYDTVHIIHSVGRGRGIYNIPCDNLANTEKIGTYTAAVPLCIFYVRRESF